MNESQSQCVGKEQMRGSPVLAAPHKAPPPSVATPAFSFPLVQPSPHPRGELCPSPPAERPRPRMPAPAGTRVFGALSSASCLFLQPQQWGHLTVGGEGEAVDLPGHGQRQSLPGEASQSFSPPRIHCVLIHWPDSPSSRAPDI